MKYLLQLRQVLQSRQTQRVSDLLATIDRQGLLANKHGALAQLFSKEVKVGVDISHLHNISILLSIS